MFSNKNVFHIEKIEKIMQLEDYVDIQGKNIAMEIIINNNTNFYYKGYILIVFV